jgi:DNA-binding beta-propeller fold protein YncE
MAESYTLFSNGSRPNRVQSIMGFCALGTAGAVWLLAGIGLAAQVAPIPRPDELPGRPYAIQNKWIIGGSGDWDYLTLDPTARQLFVAHGSTVQVVDIETGAVVGTVGGFNQAHAVVLDNPGPYGYATDGAAKPIFVRDLSSSGKPVAFAYAGGVKVFDRRSFRIVANIVTTASLRALTLDPETGLLFALGTDLSTLPPPEPNRRSGPHAHQAQPPRAAEPAPPPPAPCGTISPDSSERIPESMIAVIDPAKLAELAEIRVCGSLGSLEADGAGGLFVTFTTLNMAARLDTSALLQLLPDRESLRPNFIEVAGREYTYNQVPQLDWRTQTRNGAAQGDLIPELRAIPLAECQEPHGLAIDSRRNRLFVGCNNMKLAVLDSVSGAPVASFTVGPGTDSVAFDAAHGLIFSANGGGYGSVTVIRQDLTDSYAIIQNLPTMERARTMAVDSTTGLVYLVTTIYGANISTPYRAGRPGSVKYGPLDGSFQVLVVGN